MSVESSASTLTFIDTQCANDSWSFLHGGYCDIWHQAVVGVGGGLVEAGDKRSKGVVGVVARLWEGSGGGGGDGREKGGKGGW